MSDRSGYDDSYDGDYWPWIRWRGAVHAALRGERGQAFLRELVAALDALPVHELSYGELTRYNPMAGEQQYCALGAVCRARGWSDQTMADVDGFDREGLADQLGIATAMVAEIMYENDNTASMEPAATRFERLRRWALAWLDRPRRRP